MAALDTPSLQEKRVDTPEKQTSLVPRLRAGCWDRIRNGSIATTQNLIMIAQNLIMIVIRFTKCEYSLVPRSLLDITKGVWAQD